MRDWVRLQFLWILNIPMTATELSLVKNSHRSHIYRLLAGIRPATEGPRRWRPRDVECVLLGANCCPDQENHEVHHG